MALEKYLFLAAVLAPVWLVLYFFVPYFTTYKHFRHIPGPFFAKVSPLYSLWHAYVGDLHLDVLRCHEKYGKSPRPIPTQLHAMTDMLQVHLCATRQIDS